jgi:hypothetical protein
LTITAPSTFRLCSVPPVRRPVLTSPVLLPAGLDLLESQLDIYSFPILTEVFSRLCPDQPFLFHLTIVDALECLGLIKGDFALRNVEVCSPEIFNVDCVLLHHGKCGKRGSGGLDNIDGPAEPRILWGLKLLPLDKV